MEHNSMEVDGLDHFSFETWVMAVGSSRSSSWVFFYPLIYDGFGIRLHPNGG